MPNEKKSSTQYDPFDYNHDGPIREAAFPFLIDNSFTYTEPSTLITQNSLQAFDLMHMSFTDYLHGSTDYPTAFDMSEVICPIQGYSTKIDAAAATKIENPSTDSSISCPSNDLAAQQHSQKVKKEKQPPTGHGNGNDKSNKEVSKPKKKEKQQREQRFAFLTKSENDHLEDGYRWRKYGQKAVKNSPYPRSYYRCTSQKCRVKKRIEKSVEDPSIVITTYEGQHNHQCPATAGGTRSPLLLASTSSIVNTSFPLEFLARFLLPNNKDDNALFYQYINAPHQHLHLPDFGQLQDLVPSNTFIFGQQP